MKNLFLVGVLAATLALSSCATTQAVDTKIQANIATTCNLIETSHTTFVAVTLTGKIKEKTIRQELAAYEGVQVLCRNQESVTVANALPLIVQAYLTVSVALKAAKEVTDV